MPGKKITLVGGRPFTREDLHGLPAQVLSVTGDRASLLSNEPAIVLRELFRRGVDVTDLEVTGRTAGSLPRPDPAARERG